MADLSKKLTTEEVYEHIDFAMNSRIENVRTAALLLSRLYIMKLVGDINRIQDISKKRKNTIDGLKYRMRRLNKQIHNLKEKLNER